MTCGLCLKGSWTIIFRLHVLIIILHALIYLSVAYHTPVIYANIKALVISIEKSITVEPATSSGSYSAQVRALRSSWKLGRTLQLVSGVHAGETPVHDRIAAAAPRTACSGAATKVGRTV